MAKKEKIYRIVSQKNGGSEIITEKTLPELIEHFGYTLECGWSYNKKINRNPKSGTALVKALNAAEEAKAANGAPNRYYRLEEYRENKEANGVI